MFLSLPKMPCTIMLQSWDDGSPGAPSMGGGHREGDKKAAEEKTRAQAQKNLKNRLGDG